MCILGCLPTPWQAPRRPGRIPHWQKDSSRDREYAVTPITRVTMIIVTFLPNDTLLARRPCRPGSPYVRPGPFGPGLLVDRDSWAVTVPHPTPVGSPANGCGPSWTRASDASSPARASCPGPAGCRLAAIGVRLGARHRDRCGSESGLAFRVHPCRSASAAAGAAAGA
jgi:hypothetical protein